MISRLRGRLLRIARDDQTITIDVNGVGYDVLLPAFVRRSYDDRPEGSEVELHTYYHVSDRQPRPLLIGFNREHERRFFERILEVEGLGPTTAARALIFSVSTVANAIEAEDVGLLRQMPEVGERTARKMIATLRGKVAEWALLKDEGFRSPPEHPRRDLEEEALEVLVGLGYRRQEARDKVTQALEQTPHVKTSQDLIREVFRAEPRPSHESD